MVDAPAAAELAELLTATANALQGVPQEDLRSHDWTQLPRVAAQLRFELGQAIVERDLMRHALARERSRRAGSSGPDEEHDQQDEDRHPEDD